MSATGVFHAPRLDSPLAASPRLVLSVARRVSAGFSWCPHQNLTEPLLSISPIVVE